MICNSFLSTVGLLTLATLLVVLPAQLVDQERMRNAPTPELIRMFGYPSEVHDVITEDGYILEIHRIPGYRFRDELLPPVLLAHGFFGSSADFVLAGPTQSLAFQLADQGYDVWLINYRGNTYGRRNVHLTTNDEAFWNFSWHENGYYDNVAYIDYVLRKTGHEKVLYAGHSMGNTALFVTFTTRPEYNSKVLYSVALGPVAYVGHVFAPVRVLAPAGKLLKDILTPITKGEFFSRKCPVTVALNYICAEKVNEQICSDFLFQVMGLDPLGFNMSLIPIIFGHDPAGSSIKTLVHYDQGIDSGNFRYYDYGPLKNLEYYDSLFPPEYNLSLVTTPTALFFGDNDALADTVDVMKLNAALTNRRELVRMNSTTFDHIDFIWGKNLKEMVNDKVLSLFNSSLHEYRSTNCRENVPELPTWGVY